MMLMVDEFNFFLVVTNTCIKCKNKFDSEANAMKDKLCSYHWCRDQDIMGWEKT